MTRIARSRSRPGQSLTGGQRVGFVGGSMGNWSTITQTLSQDTCGDMVGRPIAPSTFNCTNRKGRPAGVSGVSTCPAPLGAKYQVECSTYPVAMSTSFDTTPTPPPSGWMLDLVAGTNPSRPIVTPPTLIQDLVELPKMLMNLGQLLQRPGRVVSPQGLSSEYLGIKFGWLPLIDDINKLLQVNEYTLKRVKELHQLQSGRGLRRRLQFGEDTKNEKREQGFAAYGTNAAYLQYDADLKKKQWGTISWYPTTLPLYHQSDEEMYRFARRVVLGLTWEGIAKGVWDVIPWTWMIGWFTNVGKYALAYSNTVPAHHGAGCFMSSSDLKLTPGTVRYTSGWELRGFHASPNQGYTVSRKTRAVSNAVYAGANLPFLDGSRLSVVGALFAQRFLR